MNKLLKYLKPYSKFVILAPLLMFIEVITDILQPRFIAVIIDQGVAKHNFDVVLKMGLLMMGTSVVGLFGGVGCMVTSGIAGMNFGADIRSDIYKKIQEFSFSNIDRFKTASLITRLTNDVMQVQTIVLMSLRMLVRCSLLSIGGMIMAVSINAKLALILIVAIPLLIVAVGYIIKQSFPLFDEVQKRLDKVNGVMRENLTGVRVIKAFVRADYEKKRFNEVNENLTNITLTASKLTILVSPVMMLIMNSSIVGVIWFGGIQVNAGTMQVGEIIAFINYMIQILHALLMVALVTINFSRAKISAARISEVLEMKVDIMNSKAASDEPIRYGKVVFENVSFRYQGSGGEPVLKNISFTAEPGETVAIVGATGSGKSTLVNLVPRLYDVTEGRILIDGRDVRDINLKTLREGISVVLQESILFSGSINDNICFGKAEASEQEVIEAAEAAQAHDFIMSFANKYETQIGQRGVNVSGGQKQRLCIARAIIKKSYILILDDSTSAVDLTTEAKIQKAFKRRMKETTCFIVAQRISSVLEADRIILLENGKISAQGTHKELLKSSALYQEICISQLGREVLEDVK